MTDPTAGVWRTSPLARSTSDWPFDWLAEITAFDAVAGSHRYVGTIRQSGARPLGEARANILAMVQAPAMLRLLASVAQVIEMSDPDHPAFADSAADCLDALLALEAPLRALLVAFLPVAGAPTPIHA